MRQKLSRLLSVVIVFLMLFTTESLSVIVSADSEASYIADFRVVTDKKSVAAGDYVNVSVNLTTNYEIAGMQFPLIYDSTAFEVQSVDFVGQMASGSYLCNKNLNVNESAYKRNNNPGYWTSASVMDKYKIAFVSWAWDSTYSSVQLSSEETIVSFVFKAKKNITDISGFVFISMDFLKTSSCPGGLFFCARLIQSDPLKMADKGQSIRVNYSYSDDIICVNHTYEIVTVKPSCSEGGYTERTCSVCGESQIYDLVESLGHDWGAWLEIKAATETEAGIEERCCSLCGSTEQRELVQPEKSVTNSITVIRGTASMKSYKGEEYVAITMTPGRTVTGLYKDMVDGGTVELVDVVGTIQDRAGDYVAYQSQNKTNPVATMKVTYADGTTEKYPVVFELYEMEREIDLDISKNIRPIRGKVSLAEDAKGEYILVEMLEGQSSVGVYKATTDGSATATLDGAEGVLTEKEKLYIFYGSQNTFNPEGRLTVTEADDSQSTYRVVFKLYEMDPYVNAAKGLRPVRGAVTFDDDGTIRIKMTSGQTSVGLYKTMANGATFEIVDANGRVTNNPSSLMFYMTNNTANITATMVFTLPDGTTKEQKIIFDMGLASDPDPLTYLKPVRGTVSYQNDGTEDYIEVKADLLSTGVGIKKDCLIKYTITDIDGIMTENDSRYYVYKSQNPDGMTANINFEQSDGSYKTYKVKFVF